MKPQNLKTTSFAVLSVFVLGGCAAVSTGVGGVGGGAIAALASKGDPLITAAGAAGGALIGGGAAYAVDKSKRNARKEGYDLGRSDAVKQQYWLMQNLQKDLNQKDKNRITMVPINIPEQTNNGVVTKPTTYYLRLEE